MHACNFHIILYLIVAKKRMNLARKKPIILPLIPAKRLPSSVILCYRTYAFFPTDIRRIRAKLMNRDVHEKSSDSVHYVFKPIIDLFDYYCWTEIFNVN